MKKFRENIGYSIVVMGAFALLLEFIFALPGGPGLPFNWLAVSVFITLTIISLGLLMAGD